VKKKNAGLQLLFGWGRERQNARMNNAIWERDPDDRRKGGHVICEERKGASILLKSGGGSTRGRPKIL